jgi:hypothetical protein
MGLTCTTCKSLFDLHFHNNGLTIIRNCWYPVNLDYISSPAYPIQYNNIQFAQAINDFTLPGRRKKANERLFEVGLKYKMKKSKGGD